MSSRLVNERIENLDVSLFQNIESQTTSEERQSLLAVQRAVGNKYPAYSYLEIGSHLGGSIQPYLVDERCTTIYSIDPRPIYQPDDRGARCEYLDNSNERMLNLLRSIDSAAVSKIRCFDMDASAVDVAQVSPLPQVAFIDGEHTKSAALSDFRFCNAVISRDGVILFHDFQVIFPAILEICDQLKKQNRGFIAMKLNGSVFGIFFDAGLVHSDPFLARAYAQNKRLFHGWRLQAFGLGMRKWIREHLPPRLLTTIRRIRSNARK